MIYVYENAAGERREIVASMKNPPPEEMLMHPDLPPHWPLTQEESRRIVFPPGTFEWFRRVYESPAIVTKDAGPVNYPGQKLPVSRSLPSDPREGQCATLDGHTVRRHADGSYTTFAPGNPTKDKRPIVRSRTDLKHFADRLGSTTED